RPHVHRSHTERPDGVGRPAADPIASRGPRLPPAQRHAARRPDRRALPRRRHGVLAAVRRRRCDRPRYAGGARPDRHPHQGSLVADDFQVLFGDDATAADAAFYRQLTSLEVEENADLPGAIELTLPITTHPAAGAEDFTLVGDDHFKPYARIAVTATPDGG